MTIFKAKNFADKIEIHRKLEKVPNRKNILVRSLGKCTNFRSNSPMWMACVNMAQCTGIYCYLYGLPLCSLKIRVSTVPFRKFLNCTKKPGTLCQRHYEKRLTKNIRPTDILQIYTSI